jgi:tetraacyldisaccharide 4'-kinase
MVREKVEAVIKNEKTSNSSLLEYFLSNLSRLYGAAVHIRTASYRAGILKTRRLPCRVISIGNITVGGTGKTPLTVYVVEKVHRLGYRAAVISRGYKGEAEKTGGIVSDGQELRMTTQIAGDEPTLIAMRIMKYAAPVLVGQDRFRIGQLAMSKFKPDVIILDDGFQHVKLARDINVVLLDSRHPFGNGYLLPRGVLREPISSLMRANIFILTRVDSAEKSVSAENLGALSCYLQERRLYRTTHEPVLREWLPAEYRLAGENFTFSTSQNFRQLRMRKVFAFSGIAANDEFKRTLKHLQCDLKGFIGFGDHHLYTDADVARILHSANAAGANCLCTTDKDYVRMAHRIKWPLDLAVIGVEISFGREESNFIAELKSRLTAA